MIQPNFWGVFSLFAFHSISLFILFPLRHSKRKTAAVLCVLFVISFCFCWMMVQRSTSIQSLGTALIVVVLLAVSVSLFVSAYDFPQTLFLFLLYAQAFMVVMILSAFVSQRFFNGNSLSVMSIRTVLHILVIFLCGAVRRKFKLLVQGVAQGWWPLNLVEILCFTYTGIFALRVFYEPYGSGDVIIFLLFLMIIIAVYVVFFKTIQYMYSAAEQQKAELQSKFLLEQMKAMQEALEETRRLRHDARHHNLQILEYVKAGEIDALLHYLGEYEKETERHLTVKLCDNLAANSILSAYARKAEESGVTVHFDVSMKQDVGISDIDIVAILANLMENAIHGCLNSQKPEPLIDVYIGRRAGKLVIYISNTVGQDVILDHGLPRSKDSVGISSILHSAAHYGGEYDFQSGDGVFSCQLLLKIPEKNALGYI